MLRVLFLKRFQRGEKVIGSDFALYFTEKLYMQEYAREGKGQMSSIE